MNKRSNLKLCFELSKLVKPLAIYMLLAILMGVLGNLSATFISVLGGYGILNVLEIHKEISLTYIFAAAVILAVVRGILRYAEQACNHFIAFKLLALIRDKVFKALRKLSPAKLEGKDKGDLIAVITSDIELLEVFYAHTISPCVIALIFSGILCVYISGFHIVFGVIAFAAYITIGIIIPVTTSKFSRKEGEAFRKGSGELSSFVLDSLRGIREIIQYGAGEKRLLEMNMRTSNLSAIEKQMKEKAGTNNAITNMAIWCFDVVMILAASSMYMKGKIEFSSVCLPVLAFMGSFGPVVALANLGSTLSNTFAAGNRVLDILEENPVVEEITGRESIEFEGVNAENVNFSYQDSTVLKDFSLEIPKGKIVGILGKSGSGKSTFLKLLMRFWQVDSGKIEISNRNINEINTVDLRGMESFVTQETYLFSDSIFNNIRVAKWDAAMEEVVIACKKASIHNVIMDFPKGYETLVGELGDTLSGGEKQRIGLARAFLHNSEIMLLDEPTSNLDSLNEGVILKSLKEETLGKTVVLVSHRKSACKIMDIAYSVENGRRC